VQYYLGQRISDIGNLKNATIRENEIELYQKKTGVPVTIPLINPIVKEILSGYNYSFPDEIVNSTVTLNRYIKEIAKEAGINEEISYREQKGTNIEIKKAAKWELITTHTARHSFATNMLLKGYPKEMIKKITGHKTDSAFQTYNNITSKDASKYILEKENELKKGEQPVIKQEQEQEIDYMDNNIQKESNESFESVIQELTNFVRCASQLPESVDKIFKHNSYQGASYIEDRIQKYLNNPKNVQLLEHYINILKKVPDEKIEESFPEGSVGWANDEGMFTPFLGNEKEELKDLILNKIEFISKILNTHKELTL
jgi:hypothetical protein